MPRTSNPGTTVTGGGTGDMILGTAQTVTGEKSFNAGTLKINGATSGAVTVDVPAVAGTGALTLPASGTLLATSDLVNDLTTGGTNKALTAAQGVTLKGLVDGKADAGTTTTALANRVQTSDVVDDLTTGGSTKVLSAEQGVVLKGLVDGKLAASSVVDNLTTGGSAVPLSAEQGKTLSIQVQAKADKANAEVSIATAATCDIGGVASECALLTGSVDITSFGTTTNGIVRICRAQTGLFKITANAVSLQVPGNRNIWVQAGDRFMLLSQGGGNWIMCWYQRANGAPLDTYTPPAVEAPFAAEATVTTPTLDWSNTFLTNVLGTGQGWAGNGVESIIQMSDGTRYFRYTNGSGQEVLMRSPTGGGGSSAVWTQVVAVTTTCAYSVLLRDQRTNTVLFMTGEGSTMNYQLTCRAYNSAGTQLGSTQTHSQAKGFFQGISSNGWYWRAGMGPDGTFCLIQPVQKWPAVNMQRTQTKNNATRLLWGSFNTATNLFEFPDPCYDVFTEGGERYAYHIPFIGLNGDPDHICWIAGRDIRNDEDVDYVTGLNGSTTGLYNFDRVAFGYLNKRTKEWAFFPITEKLGFLNAVNQARVSYSSGTTLVQIHEITKGTIRANQLLAHAGTNTSNTVLTELNSRALTSWNTGTGAPGSVAVASGGNFGSSATNVLVNFTDTGFMATQKRYFQAISTNDGFILFPYIQVRHTAGTTSIGAASSVHIMKIDARGNVIYDEELLGESSTFGQNYHAVWQHGGNNGLWLIRMCNQGGSSSNANDFCVLKITEDVDITPNVTTNGTTTITVNSSTGLCNPGCLISGTGIAADTRIVRWGTYSPVTGTGTIIVDRTPGSNAGITAHVWGKVSCQAPHSSNTLYAAWGTAKAPNFLPFIPDNRSGSKVGTNTLEMFQGRRANDFPTNTLSAGSDKTDHIHIRMP